MLKEVGISRSELVKFTLMPQIFPRLKRLFGTGFTYIPLFVLIVFNTLRIIPDNHPFMRRDYQGRYSLLQVLAVAANNISFDRRNIDKITIFGVVLAGIAMIILQLILCVMAWLAAPAYAYSGPGLGPRTLPEFFSNNNPDTDIAFRLLDLVFGVPGIFTQNPQVTPFHQGFHALLEFYSYGILLVATFVIIYLVTAIVLETAQSGVPFGQRFNKAWAPVRLILFFALLLPLSSGLNLAQYVLLYGAKLGSNLATNGWVLFDQTVRGPYVADADKLIAEPRLPDLKSLAGFMAVAKTCQWAEGRINGYDVKPYIVFDAGADGAMLFDGNLPAFVDLVARAQGGAIFIRFGVQDETLYPDEPGAVFPYCGELSLTIVDQGQPGAAYMQQAYLSLVGCMWSGNSNGVGNCYITDFDAMGQAFTEKYSTVAPFNPNPNMAPFIGDSKKMRTLMLMNTQVQEALTEAITRQKAQGSWARDPAQNLGWGGAGIWFNKIAEQNGAVTGAVMVTPAIRKMPYVMEFVKAEKQKEDTNVAIRRMYTPVLSSGKTITFEIPQDREIALVLNQVYQYWSLEDSTSVYGTPGKDFGTPGDVVPESLNTNPSGNIIIDVMNLFMGTRGLFDMCRNADVHPLAQLSAMGKGMIDHSIIMFAGAAGVGTLAGIAGILEYHNIKQALAGATKFFLSFATIGLTLGFLLYYVLPFMPFIYFFFAVMTWIKAIFEAMVGMPLWALAHLRIDGEGIPGDAALQGYLYIFEIFLRPICIIISFLGGIIIFSAMVKVLNGIFYLAIANLTGHNLDAGSASTITGCFNPPNVTAGTPTYGQAAGSNAQSQMDMARGVVDQFFYTVVYAIVVYLMATPCFKLVDIIPDNLMRWAGLGISAFGAMDGDPADNLMRNISLGIGLLGQGASGAGGAFAQPFMTKGVGKR